MNRSPGRRTFSLLTAALCFVLVGCSGGADTSSGQNTSSSGPHQTNGASVVPTTPAPDSPATSGPQSPSKRGGSTPEALLRAGRVAQQKVSGSTVIAIETEGNGARWEVQVVTSDGVEHEMHVSQDGRQILNGPTKESDDASDRKKHQRRISDAEVGFERAARIAAEQVTNGRVTELGLDSHHGTTVWEADVYSQHTKYEVAVDAATGNVLSKHQD